MNERQQGFAEGATLMLFTVAIIGTIVLVTLATLGKI